MHMNRKLFSRGSFLYLCPVELQNLRNLSFGHPYHRGQVREERRVRLAACALPSLFSSCQAPGSRGEFRHHLRHEILCMMMMTKTSLYNIIAMNSTQSIISSAKKPTMMEGNEHTKEGEPFSKLI